MGFCHVDGGVKSQWIRLRVIDSTEWWSFSTPNLKPVFAPGTCSYQLRHVAVLLGTVST